MVLYVEPCRPLPVAVISLPHLSISHPHFGQVYPPHSICPIEVDLLGVFFIAVLQRGQDTGSKLSPHFVFLPMALIIVESFRRAPFGWLFVVLFRLATISRLLPVFSELMSNVGDGLRPAVNRWPSKRECTEGGLTWNS